MLRPARREMHPQPPIAFHREALREIIYSSVSEIARRSIAGQGEALREIIYSSVSEIARRNASPLHGLPVEPTPREKKITKKCCTCAEVWV